MGAILANLRIIALDTSGKAHQVAAVAMSIGINRLFHGESSFVRRVE